MNAGDDDAVARRPGIPLALLRSVALIDRRTLHVLFTTLLFAGALALLYAARRTVLAFLFALFFAYLLEPLVARVQAWIGGSRGRATALTYAVLLVLLGASLAIAVPRLVDEGKKATTALPALVDQVSSGKIAWQLGSQHGWSYATETRLERLIATHRNSIEGALRDAGGRAGEIGANAGWLVLIPILAIFFLLGKDEMAEAALGLVDDGPRRVFLRNVIDDLDRMLAQYIRAQLILAALAMVAYTTFLLIVRFPYALVLGVLAGVLEFIPFVGPAITAIALAAIGFFSGYAHWLLVIAFVGVWRIVQDYVNTPRVMGEGLELHPLAAIFGILAGGEVAGIAGMFFSIPVIATLRIVWHNWRLHGALTALSPDRAPAPTHIVEPPLP